MAPALFEACALKKSFLTSTRDPKQKINVEETSLSQPHLTLSGP